MNPLPGTRPSHGVWRVALGIAAGVIGTGAIAADKPPAYAVTRLPATAALGAVVKLEAVFGSRYTVHADVEDNTTFDLRGMTLNAQPEHSIVTAFLGGEPPKPPTNITILGGPVHGTIPREGSWELTQASGGAGFYTVGAGLHRLEGARIHNMNDGWRPRETLLSRARSYLNKGRF